MSEIIAPTFHSVHRSVKNDEYAEYWLKGGRASGKSSYVSIESPLGIVTDPEANAIVYRKVADTLRSSVYDQILWGIDKLGLMQYFDPKVSPMEITYIPTGQKIIFKGADDAKKSKSIKLRRGYFKYLWFEELAEFSSIEDIRTIKASINRANKRTITFYTYNPPQTMDNWTNKEALENRPSRLVHHSTYLDIPRQWINQQFIDDAENLKETNERAYRHMYLGEVTGTGGQVFDNIVLRDIADSEINGFDKLYNGLDFGFAVDPDAFVRWHYDCSRRRLYCVEECYGAKTPTETLAQRVRAAARGGIVTCDSADPRMIDELKRRGVSAIPARKGPDSVEHGMRWLQELSEIIIDPGRCPNTAQEFKAYEYERDRDGNFISRYPDANNHTIDATRYAMESVATRRVATTAKKSRYGV